MRSELSVLSKIFWGAAILHPSNGADLAVTETIEHVFSRSVCLDQPCISTSQRPSAVPQHVTAPVATVVRVVAGDGRVVKLLQW